MREFLFAKRGIIDIMEKNILLGGYYGKTYYFMAVKRGI